jgi:hypothetical protein
MPSIENPSCVEVRVAIRFLNAKQKSPTQIHKEVVEAYDEDVISRKQGECDKLFVENVLECLFEVSDFCMTVQLPTQLEKHVKPLRK